MQKTALVLGGEGLIGYNLIQRLKNENYWVKSIDVRRRHKHIADNLLLADLKDPKSVELAFSYPKVLDNNFGSFDEVYCLASDSELVNLNSERIINSISVTINVIRQAILSSVKQIFFASGKNIHDIFDSFITEHTIQGYFIEKEFCQYLYTNIKYDYNIDTKIGIIDNVFGPMCNYENFDESIVINICNRIAKSKNDDVIKFKVDSDYIVSCLFIDDCINSIRSLMINPEITKTDISSNKQITIKELVNCILNIANKKIIVRYKNEEHIPEISNIDNDLFNKIKITYEWINDKINHLS